MTETYGLESVEPLLPILSLPAAMTSNVHAEISEHFQGYARLSVSNIQLMADRDIIEANVERLAEDFQLRGCLRDDPTYAVSVMVDSSVLAAAITEHVDLSSSLDTLLSGHPSIQAICLRGKHRILAAERAVQESDRWWVARLFDSGQ